MANITLCFTLFEMQTMVKKPDPRELNSEDFPSAGTQKEQLRFLLNYAILAPSGHNAQPWLFRLTEDNLELIFDPNRALSIVDPYNREMLISCGAALGNLEVAARFFGYQANILLDRAERRSYCVAKVTLSAGSKPSTSEIARFRAITLRQTNRSPFIVEKISENILKKCAKIADAFAVEFSYSSDKKTKAEIAKLTVAADKMQFSKPWFRVELASWMHSNKKDGKDGMSAYRFGIPDIFTPIMGFMIKSFNIGKRVAQNNKKKIEAGSPVLGLFSTQTDQKSDWVNTGRALAHLLLEFTSVGFSVSYLNQAIEIGSFRSLLRREFEALAYPQILLRIGRADMTIFSVRRPVEDCLID